MVKILMVEQDDGRVGYFKPDRTEYESKGQTDLEYLVDVEADYISQGINTRGIRDESALPTPPIGSSPDHLRWDSIASDLYYDTTLILNAKRSELNSQIETLFLEKESQVQVIVDGNLFNDGDRLKKNLGLLAGVVGSGGAIPANAKVRQADGVRVNLTDTLHKVLSQALADAYNDLLNAVDDHIDAIADADDSVLDAYDVNVGWA